MRHRPDRSSLTGIELANPGDARFLHRGMPIQITGPSSWLSRLILRLTRWRRPRFIVVAVDTKHGSVCLREERWSWRRWRWERVA